MIDLTGAAVFLPYGCERRRRLKIREKAELALRPAVVGIHVNQDERRTVTLDVVPQHADDLLAKRGQSFAPRAVDRVRQREVDAFQKPQ